MDLSQDAITHLSEHVTYPASKEDLVTACNNMSDISEEDKKMFMDKLPEGTYQNSDEVKTALMTE